MGWLDWLRPWPKPTETEPQFVYEYECQEAVPLSLVSVRGWVYPRGEKRPKEPVWGWLYGYEELRDDPGQIDRQMAYIARSYAKRAEAKDILNEWLTTHGQQPVQER